MYALKTSRHGDDEREPKKFIQTMIMTMTKSTYEILGLDGHTLSVDCSQVGVLEEGDEVSLSGLLEGHDSRGLEPEIGLWGDKDDDNDNQPRQSHKQ